MIRYALACEDGHSFESWFQNSAAYDRQVTRRLVSCPVCGSTKVTKALMTPQVSAAKKRADAPRRAGDAGAPVGAPATPAPVAMMSPKEREFRKKLKELREHLVKNAAYVGQCTTARSSIARSTARPLPTRRKSCTRKASSSTRCPSFLTSAIRPLEPTRFGAGLG